MIYALKATYPYHRYFQYFRGGGLGKIVVIVNQPFVNIPVLMLYLHSFLES